MKYLTQNVISYVVVTVILGGILYSAITSHRIETEILVVKDSVKDQKEQMKKVKLAIASVAEKTGTLNEKVFAHLMTALKNISIIDGENGVKLVAYNPAKQDQEEIISRTREMIKKGDTLSAIALRNKITVERLKELNNLRNDKLTEGNTLIVKEMPFSNHIELSGSNDFILTNAFTVPESSVDNRFKGHLKDQQEMPNLYNNTPKSTVTPGAILLRK